MWKNIFLSVVLLLPVLGCGAKENEDVVSYVKQIEVLQKYNRQVNSILTQLTEEPESITDLQPMYRVMDDYEAAVKKLEQPKTSRVRAIHGMYERAFPKARRQLTDMTEPNQFSLHKTGAAFELLKKEVTGKVYLPLEGLLERFDLQDQYSIEWPTNSG